MIICVDLVLIKHILNVLQIIKYFLDFLQNIS